MIKYRENYIGTKQECIDFLKVMFSNLLKEELNIDDERVIISNTEVIEYKIKYEKDEDGNYGAFGLKVSWGEKPEKEEEIILL